MLWETEAERLELLREVLAEQASKTMHIPAPTKRRNFAPHLTLVAKRAPRPVAVCGPLAKQVQPAKPQPYVTPIERAPVRHSPASIAIARYLARTS